MSYLVLARKWRPGNLSEMVGQEHVVRALGNALDNDRLHHAYLFTGTRGVGKTTLARILAKSLNCETGVSARPCGKCSVCREIDDGRHVDLLEVDAASKTGVDDTRDLLENVPYAPVRGRYKVYLIDEVHMFSGHSFNALLKTLEEPPPHVKFVLATTDPQKVPVTVLSRCLQFNLKRLSLVQIEGQLRRILDAEGIAFDAVALGILALAADGSMRDALSLLDQAIGFGGGAVRTDEVRSMLGVVATEALPRILTDLHRGDARAVIDAVSGLAERSPDFAMLLRDLLTLLHRVAVLQLVPDAAQAGWGDVAVLRGLSETIPPEVLQLYYQIALIGQRDLPLAPDLRAGFEMVLLRMLAFRPEDAAPHDVEQPPAARPQRPGDSGTGAEPRSAPPVPRAPPPAATQGAPAEGSGDVQALLGDWHQLLKRMSLKGMAAQLAEHCVFQGWDGKRLALGLDPTCKGMVGSLAERRLAEALSGLLGVPVSLDFQALPEDAETPAQRGLRERRALDEATRVEVEKDPLVLALQDQFGAEVVADSIRRNQ